MFLHAFIIVLFFANAVAAADLTACGVISSSGTYVLQNDVSSDGTCFMVTANDVTIDTNGHTITYDNAAPITVSNGSFESADMSGWDLSGAPAAVRASGVYLDRTVYDGSYALKIPAPLTQDQSITTVSSYTLTANMPCSASVMMWQPYDVANAANADIYMKIEIIQASDNSVLAVRDSRDLMARYTTRGFQYVRALYTPTVNVAVKIRLTVTGASTATNVGQAPFGAFYFDDVKIQQTDSIGVQFGGTSSKYGVSNTWGRRGAVVSTAASKGKIVQGQNKGDFSHAIIIGGVPSDVNNLKVDNQEITVYGNSTKAILTSSIANGIISNNLIHGYNSTIQVRDHYNGSLIHVERNDAATGTPGEIHDNVITHGIQTGIYLVGSLSGMRHKIYNNTISLQSKYTNDFAIVSLRDYGSEIYNNIINCSSGSDSCRGIYMNADGGLISGNTVTVRYLANNQEYSGCGGWAYGIQLETGAKNSVVNNNTVTAHSDVCSSIAFRYYGPNSTDALNNTISDNTFNALAASGSNQTASTVGLIQTYSQHMTFTNNILRTNSNWLSLGVGAVTDLNRSTILDGNTYQLSYPKAIFYHPLTDMAYGTGEYAARNVSLINNIYGDATVTSDLSTAQFKTYYLGYGVDTYAHNIIISTTGVAPPDTRPPTTTPNKQGRFTSSQTVTLSANETATTVYCRSTSTDCSPATSYSAPVKVLVNRPYEKICYKSTDTASNAETAKCTEYYKRRSRK